MGVGASGSGAQGVKALKQHGLITEPVAEKLMAEYPDAKTALEEHVAGNFTTKEVTVEAVELEDADTEFIKSSVFSADEAKMISTMTAFKADTKLPSGDATVAVRCIPAAKSEGPVRVALFLQGMGDDRCTAMWSKFWPSLHERGFHILAFDFPGYGRASGEDNAYKPWSDLDGELLLRLVAALKLPPGCITVYAEGIGGVEFLRAFAKDPKPFAPHHILLNVQIPSVPSGLKEAMDSVGGSLCLAVCEMFYDGQTNWVMAGAMKMIEFLFDPTNMGQLGTMVYWKVKDPDVAKKTGGSGLLGQAPAKPQREGDFWSGKQEKLKGLARGAKVMVFIPSKDCTDEFVTFVTQPARKIKTKDSGMGPDKSAIEMGEINENFQVFIRVRPLLEREVKKGAKNCLDVTDTDFPRDPPPQRIVVTESGDDKVKGNYVFNRVFEDKHGQDAVYAGTVKAYVSDFLAGTNVTVFAYGQTGTGKTHTIMGPDSDKGIIPHCLADIFAGMPGDKKLCYEYVQLYMEEFKDLMVEQSKGELKLVDSKTVGVHLPGLTSTEATSEGDVLKALEEGGKRRATRSQDMNQVSSRSHAILMLRLIDKDTAPAPDAPATTMFIVDLAGSERVSRSGVSGQGFDEATSINQSLTALGRVVVALIDADANSKTFIPYSSAPLTMALKGGLGGNSKTCLIACVTQAEDSLQESVGTLRFAMQASHVKNKVAGKESQDKKNAEADQIASAGNAITFSDGKASVDLPSGSIEVWGHWDAAIDIKKTVVLLHPLNTEPSTMKDLIDAFIAKGCRVLAPKLPGEKEKDVEQDAKVVAELFDYAGLPDAVIYGRDWGAIRAVKFRILHPKRCPHIVLEDFYNKIDDKEYKARTKKDPGYAMAAFQGPFFWVFDGTFPKNMDGKPGTNMTGFKGKVTLLWPMQTKGKHDPKPGTAIQKVGAMFGKAMKTKNVEDSYNLTVEEVADKCIACIAS